MSAWDRIDPSERPNVLDEMGGTWEEIFRIRHFDAAYRKLGPHYPWGAWKRADRDTFVSHDGRYRVWAAVTDPGASTRVVEKRVDER